MLRSLSPPEPEVVQLDAAVVDAQVQVPAKAGADTDHDVRGVDLREHGLRFNPVDLGIVYGHAHVRDHARRRVNAVIFADGEAESLKLRGETLERCFPDLDVFQFRCLAAHWTLLP